MERILNYHIPIEYEAQNILGFLKSRGYSHNVITLLKHTKNGILLNGKWSRVHDLIHAGDLLTIHLIETLVSDNIVPVPLPLSILYEDQDLMIINKPAGMPIHPSQGNYDNTLANALVFYFSSQDLPFTYRCINRLDRDTTGLLIVAKHLLSACLLSNMTVSRSIRREYLALAAGLTPPYGTIEAPIARVFGSTIKREVNDIRGEYACTHYTRLDFKHGYSLVSLKLETGRTHQIRVHMKYIGHPLPGDFLYNPDYTVIGRQALHSHRLDFMHPITGQPLTFTAPLPEDMVL